MKQELQQKLFDKYPRLFRDKDAPPTQSCMCWGIECGDGWYNLIDYLCSQLSEDVIAQQVKEKFGGLRFYVLQGTGKDDDYIDAAQNASFFICEECGSAGRTIDNGWIKTLCEKCEKESK